MTDASAAGLRAIAFGDLETGVWGVAVVTAAGTAASFADPVAMETDDESEWTLSGAGVELRFVPSGEAATFGPPAEGIDGVAQLCQVEGAVHRDGSEQDISCLGLRARLRPASAASVAGAASARIALGWLSPDDGFAVLAVRPRRASDHQSDRLSCALLEDGHPLIVDEPRLSTTYRASGVPSRAGLELWLHEEDDGEDEHGHYPRRAGGESTGDGSRFEVGTLEARAELFRWHSRRHEGAGIYVLVTAQ